MSLEHRANKFEKELKEKGHHVVALPFDEQNEGSICFEIEGTDLQATVYSNTDKLFIVRNYYPLGTDTVNGLLEVISRYGNTVNRSCRRKETSTSATDED